MADNNDVFQARLPIRITGIVFWGLIFIGLLVAVFLLEQNENELYMRNKNAAHVLGWKLEGIIETQNDAPALEHAARRLKLEIDRERNDAGYTAVVLSDESSKLVVGQQTDDDMILPVSLHYYPNGSTELRNVDMRVYFPSKKREIADMRKNLLLTIGLSVLVFGLFLQQILHRILSGPFLSMVSTARRFSQGEDVRFDQTRNDEFGYLGRFINNAIDSMLSHQQKLRIALQRAESTERELGLEKERAEVTLHSITESVITVDLDKAVQYLNPAAEALLMIGNEDARGRQFSELINIVDENSGDSVVNPLVQCYSTDSTVHLPEHSSLVNGRGSMVAVEASLAPMRNEDGKLIGAVMVIQDVSNTRKLTSQLSYQASHDMLTGLYNRRKFEEYLGEILHDVQEENREHALCYLDLDQFKIVNDTCGHIAGDELLRQLPALLNNVLRSGDIIARLGGDEFGILLRNCNTSQARIIADKVRQQIEDFRFAWEDRSFSIGVSIGVVGINAENSQMSHILSEADMACYAAKDSGRNRVHVYDKADELASNRHGESHWTTRITDALQQNRFKLYRQPIVDIGTRGETEEHFEILVRMIDENGGIIPPSAFIPAAERYNLMAGVDRWVIREVFRMIADNDPADPILGTGKVISINLSAESLNRDDLVEYIVAQKSELGITLENICFEISEIVAISNLSKVAAFISQMQQYDCSFALDDFGSGLSSFSYLKTLPVDYIKIEGSYIKDVSRDPIDRAMVVSILQMCMEMRLNVIAEWVEDEATLKVLKEIGVEFVQGYHFGRPEAIEVAYPQSLASSSSN
jgi:diguanylate cyclase (GGDEF)-like protein/PAS domain S-box-containing protein